MLERHMQGVSGNPILPLMFDENRSITILWVFFFLETDGTSLLILFLINSMKNCYGRIPSKMYWSDDRYQTTALLGRVFTLIFNVTAKIFVCIDSNGTLNSIIGIGMLIVKLLIFSMYIINLVMPFLKWKTCLVRIAPIPKLSEWLM